MGDIDDPHHAEDDREPGRDEHEPRNRAQQLYEDDKGVIHERPWHRDPARPDGAAGDP